MSVQSSKLDVQRSPPHGAVFLSYASQDADAAQKICEALRAGGVEVWFDKNELAGGDAWDQKIRGQVASCALFVPLISATTQARREGYFRIEWRLAAQRTHAMADGTPFLLPVVIDDTRDADALVPPEFKAVQWTRLPGGDTQQAAFFKRVQKILAGEVAVAGGGDPGGSLHSSFPVQPGPPVPATTSPRWLRPILASAVIVIAVLAFTLWKKNDQAISPPAPAALPEKPVTSVAWPKDPELRRALDLIGGLETTLEDFRLADEIVNRALEKSPTDPEVVTVAARVNSAFLTRGFDFRPERTAAAKRWGERAVQLAPQSPDALHALAVFLQERGGDLSRAEALSRQACDLAPQEPLFRRQLVRTVGESRPDEALALAEENIARFPKDALAHYELSILYRNRRQWDAFNRELDATIALAPLANAINWKARYAAYLGEMAECRRWLDRVPARSKGEERTTVTAFNYALSSGDYAYGLQALDRFAEPWFNDRNNYSGPAALPRAMLLELQGKAALARQQYEIALSQFQQHQKDFPRDLSGQSSEFWILLGLGKEAEARAASLASFESIPRPFPRLGLRGWWFDAIPAALLSDRRAQALELIRAESSEEESRTSVRRAFLADRRLARWHQDPEILALLGGPTGATPTASAAPAIDPKSVAVLPFANLSDDKENEYFSDGISEELLNVLQKIPGLRVAARTSSFSFKGRNVTAQEIGRTLGVATLVEGSVRKAGGQVRISARLSRAATGEQVWSESYTREPKDVFAVQSELAETIVGRLRGQLDGTARDEIRAQVRAAEVGGTRNVEAHELYLQGRYQLVQFGSENLDRAAEKLERAVRLDPQFALAWTVLARTRTLQSGFGRSAQEVVEKAALAREAVARALAAEPNLPLAYLVQYQIQAMVDFKWKDGAESIRRARALVPADADILFASAGLAYFTGRPDETIAFGRQAVALDPVNALWLTALVRGYEALDQFAEAEVEGRRITEMSPNNAWAHTALARVLIHQGKFDAAIAEAKRGPVEWARLHTLAMAYWGKGEQAESEQALQRLIETSADIAGFQIAQDYAYRRDNDQAFAWLERAYQNRDSGLAWMKADRTLRTLHDDPRWDKFLYKMGLTDAQLR